MRSYDGQWVITKIIPPSCYEISDKEGKIRGTFHKTALKKYLREPGGELIYMYKNMLIGDNSRSERNISDCN